MEKRPELNKATEIFFQELEDSCNYFDALATLVEESNRVIKIQEEAAELERQFHKIKGGAGFLGFARICELAATAESWFHAGELTLASPEEAIDKFLTTISALREERKKLIEVPSQ